MKTLSKSRSKRFTRDEYHRMAEIGLFEDQRVELIDGEIIEMPPMKNPHQLSLTAAHESLASVFGRDYWVRMQMPLQLSRDNEPEPDISVCRGHFRTHRDTPKTALLVIEISDSTILFDQTDKASLYAKFGIADYWIINLIDRQLEVMREPVVDRSKRFGYRYSSTLKLQPNAKIAPLVLPRKKIVVADLLP